MKANYIKYKFSKQFRFPTQYVFNTLFKKKKTPF